MVKRKAKGKCCSTRSSLPGQPNPNYSPPFPHLAFHQPIRSEERSGSRANGHGPVCRSPRNGHGRVQHAPAEGAHRAAARHHTEALREAEEEVLQDGRALGAALRVDFRGCGR